jgi:hypothetical protein
MSLPDRDPRNLPIDAEIVDGVGHDPRSPLDKIATWIESEDGRTAARLATPIDAEIVSVEEDRMPTRRSMEIEGLDDRDELLAEVHQALVDEVNRQMLTQFGRESGLAQAQMIYRLLDMEKLAEVALDSFQDRVALELAKGLTRLKHQASRFD